jgi:molecular chaperone GrpE
MCQTDRLDDYAEDGPVDPASVETGEWPRSELLGARKADQLATESEPEQEPAALVEESPVPVSPAEVPASEPPAQIIAAIRLMQGAVDQRLSTLQSMFEREIRAEATRERIVDRLHSELQEYKQDLLLKIQRPIFIDLIQLHDDIGKMMDAQPVEDPDRAASVRGTLDSIRTAIEDILYRQGVEPFRLDDEEFDPRRQRAVHTVPTEEPDLNKTIAARLRPGFQSGDKIIRPEIVSVHTLKK